MSKQNTSTAAEAEVFEAPKPKAVEAPAFTVGYATEAEKVVTVHNYTLKHPKAEGLEIGVTEGGNSNEAVRLRDKFTRDIAGKKYADGTTNKSPSADKRRQIQNRLFAHLMRYVRVCAKHSAPIEWPGLGRHQDTPEFFEKLLNHFPDFRDEVITAINEVTTGEEEAEGVIAKN